MIIWRLILLLVSTMMVVFCTWRMLFAVDYTIDQAKRTHRILLAVVIVLMLDVIFLLSNYKFISRPELMPMSLFNAVWVVIIVNMVAYWLIELNWERLRRIPDGVYRLQGLVVDASVGVMRVWFWHESNKHITNEYDLGDEKPEFLPLKDVLFVHASPQHTLEVIDGQYIIHWPGCCAGQIQQELQAGVH